MNKSFFYYFYYSFKHFFRFLKINKVFFLYNIFLFVFGAILAILIFNNFEISNCNALFISNIIENKYSYFKLLMISFFIILAPFAFNYFCLFLHFIKYLYFLLFMFLGFMYAKFIYYEICSSLIFGIISSIVFITPLFIQFLLIYSLYYIKYKSLKICGYLSLNSNICKELVLYQIKIFLLFSPGLLFFTILIPLLLSIFI